eukprot:TRINITY_DN6641_c0_g1_i8.p1 TRINITY_DN6641_c0_g1~~TRINITY_DN6641_c0_g1_i8.p1  ORF type:complete len:557 (-),score=63.95 TRINITY_DN6641_c0_g1_i8:730-2400(-)
METYGLWVVLGIDVVCFGIYGIMCRQLVLSLPSSGACSAVASSMKACANGVRLCFSQRRSDDPFERKVWELVTQARVERGRKLSRLSVHLVAVVFMFSFIFFGWYDFRTFDDVKVAWHLFHESNLLPGTLAFVWCIYCWLFSARTTGTTYHVWHGLFIARLCWQTHTARSPIAMFGRDGTNVAGRFIGAFCFGTPRITLGLNVVYAATKLISYLNLFRGLSEADKDIVASIWGRELGPAPAELVLCGTLWAISTIVETWNYATVRSTLEAKKSSTSEETVKSILVVMCDSVVTVDNDLVLDRPSSGFAHFLLRRPPNNSYQGVSLLDFIGTNDRQRIQEQLTASSMTPGMALSLTTTLIDGSGAALNVQMYCTCFIDIHGDRAYVIGILEVKDPSYEIGRGDRFALGDDCIEGLQTLRGMGALHAASEPDRATNASVRSDDSAATLLAIDHDQYEAFIDLQGEKWPIIGTSLRMRQFSGPQSGRRVYFAEWLRDTDAAYIVARITEAFEQFREDGSRYELAHLGKVLFQPPHSKQEAGIECVGEDLSLDMSYMACM